MYIAPKALHAYLWIRWWKEHGPDMFPAGGLDPRGGLFDKCMGMFDYMGRVPEAKNVTAGLLEVGALAKDGGGQLAGWRFSGR